MGRARSCGTQLSAVRVDQDRRGKAVAVGSVPATGGRAGERHARSPGRAGHPHHGAHPATVEPAAARSVVAIVHRDGGARPVLDRRLDPVARSFAPWGQSEGRDFRNFAALQSLQWLDLHWADMSADDFATMPHLAKLQTIFLSGEKVKDQHLLHLAQLRLPALATLSLEATSVSDAGVVPFCARYNLDCFNLFHSRNVTEQSVSALGQMTNLRTLGIGGSGLSPNYRKTPAVEQLKKLLPNCSVDYGD